MASRREVRCRCGRQMWVHPDIRAVQCSNCYTVTQLNSLVDTPHVHGFQQPRRKQQQQPQPSPRRYHEEQPLMMMTQPLSPRQRKYHDEQEPQMMTQPRPQHQYHEEPQQTMITQPPPQYQYPEEQEPQMMTQPSPQQSQMMLPKRQYPKQQMMTQPPPQYQYPETMVQTPPQRQYPKQQQMMTKPSPQYQYPKQKQEMMVQPPPQHKYPKQQQEMMVQPPPQHQYPKQQMMTKISPQYQYPEQHQQQETMVQPPPQGQYPKQQMMTKPSPQYQYPEQQQEETMVQPPPQGQYPKQQMMTKPSPQYQYPEQHHKQETMVQPPPQGQYPKQQMMTKPSPQYQYPEQQQQETMVQPPPQGQYLKQQMMTKPSPQYQYPEQQQEMMVQTPPQRQYPKQQQQEMMAKPSPQRLLEPLPSAFGKKRAVLCGVNYKGKSYSLKGCINDAKSMRSVLIQQMGFPIDSILMLTEDEADPERLPTKRNIRMAMRWLVEGNRARDSLVFHFSGHGSQQKDYNDDETDGQDETICPLDHETEGKIIDDEINRALVRPLVHGAKLHAIIDACNSGTVIDLPFICRMESNGYYEWEDQRSVSAYKGTDGGTAFCFSACDDHESSGYTPVFTGKNAGTMTYSFIKAVKTAGPSPTYGRLLNLMCSAVREAQSRLTFDGNDTSAEPLLTSSEEFDVYKKKFVL